MDKIRALLVEDDPNLGNLLKEYLTVKGIVTDLAQDGKSGLKKFHSNSYDICILDVMMPEMDGITLAKEIRKENQQIPIIFLTAKSMKDDKLEGFKAGADDYITKPFSMEELLARINAVMRRAKGVYNEEQNEFKIGKYTFNYNEQTLKIGDKVSKLTSKENELLRLLVLNKNKVMDRNEALIKIWGDDSYFNARSMDVYITKLRKHLKDDPNIEIINIHGKGFKLLEKSN
ncbi:MAG TPA: DNA-binding response regulator [Flavobacteriales bacterium]|nr:DNA-binding response regulator [Flavobacteriales bacterium]|tara:strand:- start:48 stop:740 length:693 start_codon:yes stop_codon:yes gene_type:complete